MLNFDYQGDLQQYIHQPLTEAEAQLIIGQVLEALVYVCYLRAQANYETCS